MTIIIPYVSVADSENPASPDYLLPFTRTYQTEGWAYAVLKEFLQLFGSMDPDREIPNTYPQPLGRLLAEVPILLEGVDDGRLKIRVDDQPAGRAKFSFES